MRENVVCLVMTDGRRHYIERTLKSAAANLPLDSMLRVINDDSGDAAYRAWLLATYGEQWTVVSSGARSGFGGAIRNAWRHLATTDATHIFHLEDDYVFAERVNLHQMVDLLDDNPELVQVALLRQPWNHHEANAGGLFQLHPEGYWERKSKYDEPFVVQRMFFTTNPSVYRRSLINKGWPEGKYSEGIFTHELLKTGTNGVPGDGLLFAYWGRLTDPPRVQHIGDLRIGSEY